MIKSNGKLLITKFIQPATFIAIGAIARILPHPANFAPIAAMALFGGAYMSKREALTIPFLAMVLSDLFIGFDSPVMRICVYACFAFSVFIGTRIKNSKHLGDIFSASILSSLVFFIVTNFAVWAFEGMYAKNLMGLAECFTLAIPFFRNTILGDLFYVGVFFGGYELAQRLVKRFAPQA